MVSGRKLILSVLIGKLIPKAHLAHTEGSFFLIYFSPEGLFFRNWKAHTEGSFLFIYSPEGSFFGTKAHFSVFVLLAFGAVRCTPATAKLTCARPQNKRRKRRTLLLLRRTTQVPTYAKQPMADELFTGDVLTNLPAITHRVPHTIGQAHYQSTTLKTHGFLSPRSHHLMCLHHTAPHLRLTAHKLPTNPANDCSLLSASTAHGILLT